MTKSKARKPTVSIIGAGRLGQALAIALQRAGYPIVSLVTRRAKTAERAVQSLPKRKPRVLALTERSLERLPASDLILIATPDDVIEKIASRLATLGGKGTRSQTVVHTSGALSSAALAPLAKAGLHTGSLHPLVSVSDPEAGSKALRGAFFALEGDREALRMARKIVVDLKGTSFSIQPEHKALYHAAAVMASPHAVALFDLATTLLSACGLSKETARKVLRPLMDSTAKNLTTSDAGKALTGTFARGDLATVKRHLTALSGTKQSDALEVYKLLGLHSLQLAERNGLDPQLVKPIRALLRPAKR